MDQRREELTANWESAKEEYGESVRAARASLTGSYLDAKLARRESILRESYTAIVDQWLDLEGTPDHHDCIDNWRTVVETTPALAAATA